MVLRDDAGSQAADVGDGGLGDGQDGAGALWERGGQGAVHLLFSLWGASLLPLTVRVVFNGELQQPARLLEQQVDLERKRELNGLVRPKLEQQRSLL